MEADEARKCSGCGQAGALRDGSFCSRACRLREWRPVADASGDGSASVAERRSPRAGPTRSFARAPAGNPPIGAGSGPGWRPGERPGERRSHRLRAEAARAKCLARYERDSWPDRRPPPGRSPLSAPRRSPPAALSRRLGRPPSGSKPKTAGGGRFAQIAVTPRWLSEQDRSTQSGKFQDCRRHARRAHEVADRLWTPRETRLRMPSDYAAIHLGAKRGPTRCPCSLVDARELGV